MVRKRKGTGGKFAWKKHEVPHIVANQPFVKNARCFKSPVFVVLITEEVYEEVGEMVHISVSRKDKRPVESWSDMQEIKNHFTGPERVGVQVFPRESDLVDLYNAYHIWVYPEGHDGPMFGLHIQPKLREMC